MKRTPEGTIAKNSAMLMAMNIAKMLFPLMTLPYLRAYYPRTAMAVWCMSSRL